MNNWLISESDLPVDLNTFISYTNVQELAIAAQQSSLGRENLKTFIQEAYWNYYTKPEKRESSKIKITSNCPKELWINLEAVPTKCISRQSISSVKSTSQVSSPFQLKLVFPSLFPFPVDFDSFCRNVRMDRVVDSILSEAEKASGLSSTGVDEELRNNLSLDYYRLYYMQPSLVRDKYPPALRPCPLAIKAKLMELVPRSTTDTTENTLSYGKNQDPAKIFPSLYRFPVTFAQFKLVVKLQNILDVILLDYAKEEAEENNSAIVRSDDSGDILPANEELLRQNLSHDYYHLYYMDPRIRQLYPLQLNACPSSLRQKVLGIDKLENSNGRKQSSESSDFPVDFETFCKYTTTHKRAGKFLKPTDSAEDQEKRRKKVMHLIYVSFYKEPLRRDTLRVRIVSKCPEHIRRQILEIPNVNLSKKPRRSLQEISRTDEVEAMQIEQQEAEIPPPESVREQCASNEKSSDHIYHQKLQIKKRNRSSQEVSEIVQAEAMRTEDVVVEMEEEDAEIPPPQNGQERYRNNEECSEHILQKLQTSIDKSSRKGNRSLQDISATCELRAMQIEEQETEALLPESVRERCADNEEPLKDRRPPQVEFTFQLNACSNRLRETTLNMDTHSEKSVIPEQAVIPEHSAEEDSNRNEILLIDSDSSVRTSPSTTTATTVVANSPSDKSLHNVVEDEPFERISIENYIHREVANRLKRPENVERAIRRIHLLLCQTQERNLNELLLEHNGKSNTTNIEEDEYDTIVTGSQRVMQEPPQKNKDQVFILSNELISLPIININSNEEQLQQQVDNVRSHEDAGPTLRISVGLDEAVSSYFDDFQKQQNMLANYLKTKFFEQIPKSWTLPYVLRCSDSVKAEVLRAVMDMSPLEFVHYTRIYKSDDDNNDNSDCDTIVEDNLLRQHYYDFVFRHLQVWPIDLYIPLKLFREYVQRRSLVLTELNLLTVSPKLLHWSDLAYETDFDECVREDYNRQTGRHLDGQNNTILKERRIQYYRKCYASDKWIWRVPVLKEHVAAEQSNNAPVGEDLQSNSSQPTEVFDSRNQEEFVQEPERPSTNIMLDSCGDFDYFKSPPRILDNPQLNLMAGQADKDTANVATLNTIEPSPNLFPASGEIVQSCAPHSNEEQQMASEQSVHEAQLSFVALQNTQKQLESLPLERMTVETNDPLGDHAYMFQEVKQENVSMLDKLQFIIKDDSQSATLSDQACSYDCFTITDEPVVLDETQQEARDSEDSMISMIELAKHDLVIMDELSIGSDITVQAQESQSCRNPSPTPLVMLSIPKQNLRPQSVKSTGEFVSQRTHIYHALKRIMKKTVEPTTNQSAISQTTADREVVVIHSPADPITATTSSQALSVDNTILNTTEVQTLLNLQTKAVNSKSTDSLGTKFGSGKTQSTTHQDISPSTKALMAQSPLLPEIVLFRMVKRLHYFSELSMHHLVDLNITPIGLHCTCLSAEIQHRLHMTLRFQNVNALLPHCSATLREDVTALLEHLGTFRYNRYCRSVDLKFKNTQQDNLYTRILCVFFDAQPSFGPCSIVSDRSMHRSAVPCLPRQPQRQSILEISNLRSIIKPNILSRMQQLNSEL